MRPMEITSKELREVEFRERLRGYDTTEVDEFLERVAIAVDEMQAKVRDYADRADRAERQPRERATTDDDETLRRTLVLAQRTADMAIREAQEEAAQLLDRARAEGDSILDHANESARRITSEGQRQLQSEVDRLTAQRDQLRADVRTLCDLLDNERERLSDSLTSALRWVEQGFTTAPALASHRAAPLSSEGVDAGDDVESQVEEDAAAASPRPADTALYPPVGAAGNTGDDDEEDDEEDDDELADGLTDGLTNGPYTRLRQEPVRLTSPGPTLRDTQVWQLEPGAHDGGWPA
jgi:DivIVA domain-containing protein